MGYCKVNREAIEDYTKTGLERWFRIDVAYRLDRDQFEEVGRLYPLAQPPERDRQARERIVDILIEAAEECPLPPELEEDDEDDQEDEELEASARFVPTREWLYEVLFDDRLVGGGGESFESAR